MPIDPNVLTPTIIRPISVAGVVHDTAVVQEAQARAQAYRDKQMELARDRQENDQIRGILQQSGGQLDDQTFAAIRQISPTKAMDIEKLHNDSVKSSFEIDNSKIDHDLKVLGYTSRQLAGVTDQHSYDMARAGIKATTGQDLPEQYDPALVQSWQEKGMTYAEKLSQQREDRAAKYQELTATRQQGAEERAQSREERMAAAQQQQLGMEGQRLGLEKQRVGLEAKRVAQGAASGGGSSGDPKTWETTGADVLKTIPAQWRATVKKIGDYDEDPTKVLAARGGERSMVMRWVNQYNPNYKQDEFAVRSPTRKAFTTGTQGQQINAMNTAIGHIDQLGVLVEGLNNGDFTPGNKAWNTLRTMFGSDKVTNFDTLKDALSGEVASILSKSGATVSGIAEAKEKINAAASPAQLAGYIKTQIPIMGSKLAALDYQYKQAMGDDQFSALSPDSKRVLEKYGFNPEHPTIGGPQEGEVRPIAGHPGAEKTFKGGKWIRTK